MLIKWLSTRIMPLYRFESDAMSSPTVVSHRVQAITRVAPSTWGSIKESFGVRENTTASFIGIVEDNTFRLRRDIRYRNSFLPQIRGMVSEAPSGSRILVTMHIHPFAVVFMCFWLCGAGAGALTMFSNSASGSVFSSLIPVGMFVIGIALTLIGFYPEAYKARRLIEGAIRRNNA